MSYSQQTPPVTDFPLVKPGDTETSALTAVVRRFSTAHTLAEVMDIATHAARALLRADGITFVLRDGDQCFYAEEDAISPLWKGQRFPLNACISGWCMTEGKAAAIRDIYQDERIPKDAYRPTFVRSLAMVPVRHDDPIAAMGAYWAAQRTIQPSELELLQTVANAAALAVAYVAVQQQVRRSGAGAQTRSLMNQEREHRLRNMSATVQAVINQTLRDDPDRAALIGRRIEALMATGELEASDGASSQSLRELLTVALEPYDLSRVDLSGDEIRLPLHRANALAAIIHEWATNAAKYGAFSVPEGRLSVSWLATDNEVRMVWQELNGPEVVDTGRMGFGSHFVAHVMHQMEGTVETDMRPYGIVRVLHVPLEASE